MKATEIGRLGLPTEVLSRSGKDNLVNTKQNVIAAT